MAEKIAISGDGTRLSVKVHGNEVGPEVLFIHGFNQCRLSWMMQLTDPSLSAALRMVSFDLRGHGNSDKPGPEHYYDDRLWADDVAAVIAASGLKRPLIVAWSYGGRVITDYVRFYGQDGIAGINFVAAVVTSGKGLMGPERRHFGPMTDGDLVQNIEGTRAFIHACTAAPLSSASFETMLAYNMIPTPLIRKKVLERSVNEGDLLPALTIPVLFSHGTADQIVLPAMSEAGARMIPHATLSVYEGIGHMPFMEDAPRFNTELLTFARACDAGR